MAITRKRDQSAAEQIAELFLADDAVVWELVEHPRAACPEAVAIEEPDGTVVGYAQPTTEVEWYAASASAAASYHLAR